MATFGLHERDSFDQDGIILRPWAERVRRVLVCIGFEGVDGKEAVWNGLQTEIFKAREARSR